MQIENVFNRENLTYAGKIALGTVAAGATAAGAGCLLEAGGAALSAYAPGSHVLSTIGSVMQAGGDTLFILGKYTAYTVLVPAYAALYAVPKWLVETGIPKTLTSLHDYLLVPMNKYILSPLINRITWFAEKLEPLAEKILNFTYEHIFKPLYEKCEWLLDMSEQALDWTVNNLFKVWDLIDRHLCSPVEKAMGKAITLTYKYLLDPLGKQLTWVVNNLIPSLQKVVDRVASVTQNLFSSIASTAHAIYERIIEDIGALIYGKGLENPRATLSQT